MNSQQARLLIVDDNDFIELTPEGLMLDLIDGAGQQVSPIPRRYNYTNF